MAYFFTLPESYNPAEFGLPHALVDPSRWLISTIVRKTANRDTDERGCVRLHSSILRRVMHDRYSEIVKALDGRAIDTYGHSAGRKSKGYRLHSRYLSDRHVRVPCRCPMLAGRIQRDRDTMKRSDKALWLPIHDRLDELQQNLTISDDADDVLSTLPSHTRLCQDVLVGYIRRREYPFSVSSTGRVFNAVTGLKRELRTCLQLAGEPIAGIDIRCAQPALLGTMMIQNYPSSGWQWSSTYKVEPRVESAGGSAGCLPADFLEWLSLVSDGSVYDVLSDSMGLDRDTVKHGVLVDVLAKKGNYPSEIEDAFKERFPTVFKYIQDTNRDDHAELIRRLQRAESDLVIGSVAPRLVGTIPVVSLHDALYGRLGDLDDIQQAFDDASSQEGFSMAFARE